MRVSAAVQRVRNGGLGARVKSLVRDLEGIFVVMEVILGEFRVWVFRVQGFGGFTQRGSS